VNRKKINPPIPVIKEFQENDLKFFLTGDEMAKYKDEARNTWQYQNRIKGGIRFGKIIIIRRKNMAAIIFLNLESPKTFSKFFNNIKLRTFPVKIIIEDIDID
jgi:hypothetical protein